MSNLHNSYTKILSLLHEIEENDCYLNQVRTPALSDKELIALCLASESIGVDSERYLFKQLPAVSMARLSAQFITKGGVDWEARLSGSDSKWCISCRHLKSCT